MFACNFSKAIENWKCILLAGVLDMWSVPLPTVYFLNTRSHAIYFLFLIEILILFVQLVMIIGVDSKREYQCQFLYQFQPSIFRLRYYY